MKATWQPFPRWERRKIHRQYQRCFIPFSRVVASASKTGVCLNQSYDSPIPIHYYYYAQLKENKGRNTWQSGKPDSFWPALLSSSSLLSPALAPHMGRRDLGISVHMCECVSLCVYHMPCTAGLRAQLPIDGVLLILAQTSPIISQQDSFLRKKIRSWGREGLPQLQKHIRQ